MDKVVQSAPVGKRVHYERRRPEEATLFRFRYLFATPHAKLRAQHSGRARQLK
jgi:hypothetical protein